MRGDKAILGFDPPSPLLQLCPDLKALKRKAHIAYQSRYGLPIELSKIVKHADLVLLATEKRDLMLAEPTPWLPMPDPSLISSTPGKILTHGSSIVGVS